VWSCELIEKCSYLCQPIIIHYWHKKNFRTFLSKMISVVPICFLALRDCNHNLVKIFILSPLGPLRLGLFHHSPQRPPVTPLKITTTLNLEYSWRGQYLKLNERKVNDHDCVLRVGLFWCAWQCCNRFASAAIVRTTVIRSVQNIFEEYV
jgi:hypothetical protein